ncbi:hypothetical protein KY284_010743 [Solanum tuberosum]|nr:hypothetical protein KY284_010743 [Solanum tuberosum]
MVVHHLCYKSLSDLLNFSEDGSCAHKDHEEVIARRAVHELLDGNTNKRTVAKILWNVKVPTLQSNVYVSLKLEEAFSGCKRLEGHDSLEGKGF